MKKPRKFWSKLRRVVIVLGHVAGYLLISPFKLPNGVRKVATGVWVAGSIVEKTTETKP